MTSWLSSAIVSVIFISVMLLKWKSLENNRQYLQQNLQVNSILNKQIKFYSFKDHVSCLFIDCAFISGLFIGKTNQKIIEQKSDITKLDFIKG